MKTELALHTANQFIQSIFSSPRRLAAEMLHSYPKAFLISCNIIYYPVILIDSAVLVEIQQQKRLISLVTSARYFLAGLTY